MSLFRPGDGALHRTPAGVKLAALIIVALVVSLVPLAPPVAVGLVVCAIVAFPLAGLPAGMPFRQLWGLRWLVLMLAVSLVMFTSPEAALVSTSRIVALILAANLVTATSRTRDLLTAIARALSPLRPLGVDPERASLVLLLAITSIPVVGAFAGRVGDALRARGGSVSPRALVPLLVLTLRHADDVGDALAARGIA